MLSRRGDCRVIVVSAVFRMRNELVSRKDQPVIDISFRCGPTDDRKIASCSSLNPTEDYSTVCNQGKRVMVEL